MAPRELTIHMLAPMDKSAPNRIGSLGKWLVGVLVLVILTDVFTAFSDLDQMDLFSRLGEGEDVSFEEATQSDDRAALSSGAQFLAVIAAAIVWIVWFRRAYINVPRISEGQLRFGRGWATGSWFVPFLNLVRPKQIMNDIWRAGDTAAPAGVPFDDRPVAGLIHLWWAAWLVITFLDNIAGRLLFRAETVPDQHGAAKLALASDLADAAGAVLAIFVVRAVSRRYEARRQQVTESPPGPSASFAPPDALRPAGG
jgi:hypothetical protein